MKILNTCFINNVLVVILFLLATSFVLVQADITTPTTPGLDDGRFVLTAPIVGINSTIISANTEFTIPLTLSVAPGEEDVKRTLPAFGSSFGTIFVNNDAYRGQFGFGVAFNPDHFEVVSAKTESGTTELPYGNVPFTVTYASGSPLTNDITANLLEIPSTTSGGTESTTVSTLIDFFSGTNSAQNDIINMSDLYLQQDAATSFLFDTKTYSDHDDQSICARDDVFADETDFNKFKSETNNLVSCVGIEYTNDFIAVKGIPNASKPLLFSNTISPIEYKLRYIGTEASTVRVFAVLPSSFTDLEEITSDTCGEDGSGVKVACTDDFTYPWGTSKGEIVLSSIAGNPVSSDGIRYAEYVDYSFGPSVAPTLTGPTYVQSDGSDLVSNEFYNSINAKIVVSDVNGFQSQVASYKTVNTSAECDTTDTTATAFGNSIPLIATSSSVADAVREGVFALSNDELNGKYLCIKISDSLGLARTIVSATAISSLDTTTPTVALGSAGFAGGSIQSTDANKSYVEIPVKINNGTDGTSASLNTQDEMTITVSGGCPLPSIYSNASPGVSLLEPSGSPLALKYTTDPTDISGAAGLKFRFALSNGSYNCILSVTDRAGNAGTLQIPAFTFSRQATLVTDITAALSSSVLTVTFNDATFADTHTAEFSIVPTSSTTCDSTTFTSGITSDPYDVSAYEIAFAADTDAARSGTFTFTSEAAEGSNLCVRVTDNTEMTNPVYLTSPLAIADTEIETDAQYSLTSPIPILTGNKKPTFSIKVDQPVGVSITGTGCAEISPTSIAAANRNTEVEFTISAASDADLAVDTLYDCTITLTPTDVNTPSTFKPSTGTGTATDGSTSITEGSFYIVKGASVTSLAITPDSGTDTGDKITNTRTLSALVNFTALGNGDSIEIVIANADSSLSSTQTYPITAAGVGMHTFTLNGYEGGNLITVTAITAIANAGGGGDVIRISLPVETWEIDTVAPTFDIADADSAVGNLVGNKEYFNTLSINPYTLTNASAGGSSSTSIIESVKLSVDGAEGVDGTYADTTYTFPSLTVTEGEHTLSYSITDTAGHLTTKTKIIVADASVPTTSQTSEISVKNSRTPSFDLLVNHNQTTEEVLVATFAGSGSRCSNLSLKNSIKGSGTTETTYKITLRGGSGTYDGCTISLSDLAGNSFASTVSLADFRVFKSGGGGRPGGPTGAPVFAISSTPAINPVLVNPIGSKEYKVGDSSPLIKKIQVVLNNNGCKVSVTGAGSAGKETEYFGQGTRNAVICYQAKNGLGQTGIIDRVTYAKLFEIQQTSHSNVRERLIITLRAEISRISKIIIDLLKKRIKNKEEMIKKTSSQTKEEVENRKGIKLPDEDPNQKEQVEKFTNTPTGDIPLGTKN